MWSVSSFAIKEYIEVKVSVAHCFILNLLNKSGQCGGLISESGQWNSSVILPL